MTRSDGKSRDAVVLDSQHIPDRFRSGTITESLVPTLTIKGLPHPLYRRLKQQAAAHRRSLNGEIIVCLERAVGVSKPDPANWLAEARRFRERVSLRPLSARQLQSARTAGRA